MKKQKIIVVQNEFEQELVDYLDWYHSDTIKKMKTVHEFRSYVEQMTKREGWSINHIFIKLIFDKFIDWEYIFNELKRTA